MNNFNIFVSSSDSYSDIWPVFFDLFRKNWPEYTGIIYLNTEEKTFQSDGLNILCTQIGKLGSFGKVFRAGLDKVEDDNVLLIMIDYLIMSKVNQKKIEEYFQFFQQNKLDSLCLVNQDYPNTIPSNDTNLILVTPPAPHIMFTYQIAFWKKSILYEMALPHENPWMSEWYGSLRAEKMKIKLACLKKNINRPINYDLRGCLHQGKWLNNAVEFLNSINYIIDFNKRGYYKYGYTTFKYRIKAKYMIWTTGLKGSYLDLMKRKRLD